MRPMDLSAAVFWTVQADSGNVTAFRLIRWVLGMPAANMGVRLSMVCCARTHVVHMPDLTPKCCEGKCRLGQREDGTDGCLGDRNCHGDACCSDSECSQVNSGVCQ